MSLRELLRRVYLHRVLETINRPLWLAALAFALLVILVGVLIVALSFLPASGAK